MSIHAIAKPVCRCGQPGAIELNDVIKCVDCLDAAIAQAKQEADRAFNRDLRNLLGRRTA